MKRLYLLTLALTLTLTLSAHPWKPSHYVIIDTDGGIDDMRAITMLLASPDVRVLAMTTSPGVLSADNAYKKVKSLLNSFYHEGIPVGINRMAKMRADEFSLPLQQMWGDEEGIVPTDAPDHLKVITEILKYERTKVSFISLGSMSTAWDALRKIPEFRTQVKDFIWSADGEDDKAGFNYNSDREASVKILRQEIPVKIVKRFALTDPGFYNDDLVRSIIAINTPYAKKISELFRSETIRSHDFAFQGTDDMVPLFLHYPDLFISKVYGSVSECTPSDEPGIKNALLGILRGETVKTNQVIKDMPSDPSFYLDDVSPFVNEIVEKHGLNEWTSGVIANELHRHLGVFAIIGVKMGIRAREYFNTGVDEFHAVSYAGSTPPLSCMNDGIQVSTGATPGHGLLTVRNDTLLRPAVDFTYLNRTIRITLKPELAAKISSELKEINFIYGLDSNIYWELVRKNSIKYWRELDRHEIFIIEALGY